MGDTVTISVEFPTDEQGLIGRECPNCGNYFKLKPGTGLPTTSCSCPYCEHTGVSSDFFTQEQIEYLESVAAKRFIEPLLRDFQEGLKRLESSSNSYFQIRVSGEAIDFPIKYYSERDVETNVTCDNCSLVFAVYGVFARCPDCTRLTSMSIFKKSLEVARKRLNLVDRIPTDERELADALLADTLSAGVAAFDSLGKRLRGEYPALLPSKPRNLFQNLEALSDALESSINSPLEEILGSKEYAEVYEMFQVRHLWDHSFGEIDEDFIAKTKTDRAMLRKKYELSKAQVLTFLDRIENAGLKIREALNSAMKTKGLENRNDAA